MRKTQTGNKSKALVCTVLGGLVAATMCSTQTVWAQARFSGSDSRIITNGRQQTVNWQYSPNGTKKEIGWVGSYAKIRFRNSTSIRINIRCRTAPGYAANTQLVYFLDGNWLRRETVGADWGGTTTIATGLSTGEHTLIVRRDGDADNILWLEAVQLDNGGELLQASESVDLTRQIEFYGDSVTEQCCTIKLVNSTTDGDTWGASNYYTYGARVGRIFNSDTRFVAKGGMGMSTGFWFHNLREVWDKIYAANPAPVWNFSNWQADVVVVATGQNDQFQYDPATDWYGTLRSRYIAQLKDLRAKYPNAYIYCINTTMTDPNFLNGVFAAVRRDSQLGADSKLYIRAFPQQTHGGHPNGDDHQAMGVQLGYWIQERTGWSGTPGSGAGAIQVETGGNSGNSGDTHTAIIDDNASAGIRQHYASNAVGDYLIYKATYTDARTYDVFVRQQRAGDRGIFQVAWSNSTSGPWTNIGSPIDGYGAFGPVRSTAGTATFSGAGPKYFRFFVTGKNGSSSNYNLSIDNIELRPR
jgi:hypothetical protein